MNRYEIFVVLAVLLLPLAAAQEPEMVYDDLDRLVKIDSLLDQDDIYYTYYGETEEIKEIRSSYSLFEYDSDGNLIKETYPASPGSDRQYTYYPDGSLRSMGSAESTATYEYNDEGRVTANYVEIDGNIIFEYYDYYQDGSIKKLENAKGSTTYLYDDIGNLVQETITETSDGEEATYTIYYEYDTDGNIIRESDSEGNEISWTYEQIPYECIDFECLDNECIEYETIEATCYYSRMASRTVGNYKVDMQYTDDGILYSPNAGDPYSLTEVYNDEGLLIEDEEYYYEYDPEYQFYQAVSKLTGEATTFATNDEGLVSRIEYSSGLVEDYSYDPLGQVVKVSRTFSIGDELMTKTYYATTPGDLNSLVGASEFSTITGAVIISPPPEPGVEVPKEEEPVEAPEGAGPDYLMIAIITIIMLMVAIIALSRLRGR